MSQRMRKSVRWAHTFDPSTVFKGNMDYIASSRLARATPGNPVSKANKTRHAGNVAQWDACLAFLEPWFRPQHCIIWAQ